MEWLREIKLVKLRQRIRNLPIRLKLLYGYLIIFLLVIIVGNSFLYFFVRETIRKNIESELSNNTLTIQNMVEAAVNASITNHLRVIAEINLDIITSIYHKNIPESEAKAQAGSILTSQTIGKTGYIYVINSQGIIQVHPNKELWGKDLSENNFIHLQKQRRFGYIEYDWANPGEEKERAKALFMTYFGPWDWIISASSYRDEFSTLLDIDDIRKSILSVRFGKTGYPYVMDSMGNLLIHPKLEGTNIYNSEDSGGNKFIQEICRKKNGKIIYPWQNPGEDTPRDKLVFFSYIPELDWIIASSSYLDEFYQPLETLRLLTVTSVIIMTILVISLTWQISNSITKPLKYLMAGLQAASAGDFSKRLSPQSDDELGKLEKYFNTFLAQLQESNDKLYESEKDFRSIFENSVEGIFQFDLEGNILKVNPSFFSMLGYGSAKTIIGNRVNFHRDILVKKELWDELLEQVISEGTVKGCEIQVYRKSGSVYWCLLNATKIHDKNTNEIIRIEGFLSDINDKKIAQESQEKTLEDLELMVSQRTTELSGRIKELEQRDILNRYMAEMADMLQSCRSIKETFPVINQYLMQFFPNDHCSLYLHGDSQDMIDRVIPAPTSSDPFSSMINDSCWALRQGKNYLFKDMDLDLTCDHVEQDEAKYGYLCIPLIAHGITIGLLHIAFTGDQDNGQENSLIIERKTRLCSRLAEHLSLALANLRLQEELKQKSIQDSLTGLANRRHMEEILRRQFYRLRRYDTPCSIIMLDVDHFKRFNDTYGHDVGDLVLKELGKYLQSRTRGEDLACRYGGEEFIIIMVDTDITEAKNKAEKLLTAVSDDILIHHNGEDLRITVSIGVASGPVHGDNTHDLIKSADDALYKAKQQGRNQVVVAEETTDNGGE